MDIERVDPILTAKIVGSYARHHTVGAGQLSDVVLHGQTHTPPPKIGDESGLVLDRQQDVGTWFY
jgi:hypothetical protein